MPTLSYYNTWSEAKTFANAVGYPEGTGREQDMTFFVPGAACRQGCTHQQPSTLNHNRRVSAQRHPTDSYAGMTHGMSNRKAHSGQQHGLHCCWPSFTQ